jgi:hypothetical protein
MKLLSKKPALILLGLMTILLVSHCNSPSTSQFAGESSADPNVIAQIDQYVITKEQLRQRLLQEIYPNPYNFMLDTTRIDTSSVLREMIAEKAMIIEAREQGYLENDSVKSLVKRYTESRLVNLLLQNYLKDMKDKITATEAEIQQRMQADPNSDPARVKAIIVNTKARQIVSQYYNQLSEKFHVKKLSENYPQAVKIHDRLLNHPKTPQKMKFIRNIQIKEEMTPEEKSIVLATYDYGQVTLEDWFTTLCESAPPSRPKNLNTTKGVEQLLNRALMIPVYLAEAKLQNLDKDENFLKQLREYEDARLLNAIKSDKYKQVEEPTEEEILACYNNNKEIFRTGRLIKTDQIWCDDLKTAEQVKKELNEGKDFEAVKQEYSILKNSKPSVSYPTSEGLFWDDMWKAEPNDIIGPMKGFYNRQIKWRIVKILEKQPGEIKEYSKSMDGTIKNGILTERRKKIISEFGLELLKKYPYKIYKKRLKNIDPLDIQ